VGFVSDIESDNAPKDLSEDIVRFISIKKKEPEWMLEWRLKAYRHWKSLNQEEPTWANIHHPKIDFQDIIYYSALNQNRNSIHWMNLIRKLRQPSTSLGFRWKNKSVCRELRGCSD